MTHTLGMTTETAAPAVEAETKSRPEDLWQVVLHNDDVNSMIHVVTCLMQVFGHPWALACKIMLEAHRLGRAVAEVENETPARRHRDQLRSFGLSATVERL
jgi:ATP-dependent Clp protease adapter protein ClpS